MDGRHDSVGGRGVEPPFARAEVRVQDLERSTSLLCRTRPDPVLLDGPKTGHGDSRWRHALASSTFLEALRPEWSFLVAAISRSAVLGFGSASRQRHVRLPEYRGDVLGGHPSAIASGSILGKPRDGPARAPSVRVQVPSGCGPHSRHLWPARPAPLFAGAAFVAILLLGLARVVRSSRRRTSNTTVSSSLRIRDTADRGAAGRNGNLSGWRDVDYGSAPLLVEEGRLVPSTLHRRRYGAFQNERGQHRGFSHPDTERRPSHLAQRPSTPRRARLPMGEGSSARHHATTPSKDTEPRSVKTSRRKG